jgi:hypothetical protein
VQLTSRSLNIILLPNLLLNTREGILLKVAQINYVTRNQLHCTANLNFGLMRKKAKLFISVQLIFFLDHVLLLAELAQKFKFFKIAV